MTVTVAVLEIVAVPAFAVAVTVASRVVVSVVAAWPLGFVVATEFDRLPAVVANVTVTPVSGLPLASDTKALIAELPPEETRLGLGVTVTRAAAAPPTVNFSGLVV